MADELRDHIFGNKPGPFKAEPFYSATGDFLSFFWKNEDGYAKKVDDLLTVYLSFKTKEPIGCKIKGVRRVILNSLGGFFHCARTTMGTFILAGQAVASERREPQEEWFDEIGRATCDVDVDLDKIEDCCAVG